MIFFFAWPQSAYIHKSQSARGVLGWNCVWANCVQAQCCVLLVPHYTRCTEAQKEHGFAEDSPLPVMEVVERYYLLIPVCSWVYEVEPARQRKILIAVLGISRWGLTSDMLLTKTWKILCRKALKNKTSSIDGFYAEVKLVQELLQITKFHELCSSNLTISLVHSFYSTKIIIYRTGRLQLWLEKWYKEVSLARQLPVWGMLFSIQLKLSKRCQMNP